MKNKVAKTILSGKSIIKSVKKLVTDSAGYVDCVGHESW